MIGPGGEFIHCDGEACEAKIKNHRWGKTKAEGWFFTRDDKFAYCPNHLPAYVSEYRARKKAKKT